MIAQFVTNDFCLKCKLCCRFVHRDSVWIPHLTDMDTAVLSKDGEARHFISRSRTIEPVPVPDSDVYVCPLFTVANNKCRIYASRPFECRLYPFLINRKEGTVFLAADVNCPFVEESLTLPEFKTYANYLAKQLTSPEMLPMLKNNPGIIHTYAGARNLIRLDV